ncbi:MAG: hypothetical protein ACRERU_12195 [Methylococcales bacterium]
MNSITMTVGVLLALAAISWADQVPDFYLSEAEVDFGPLPEPLLDEIGKSMQVFARKQASMPEAVAVASSAALYKSPGTVLASWDGLRPVGHLRIKGYQLEEVGAAATPTGPGRGRIDHD